MPPDHSAWDRTGLPYRSSDPGRGLKRLTAYQARSLARTERFDNATTAARTPTQNLGPEYLARVAAVRAIVTASVLRLRSPSRRRRPSVASDVALEIALVMLFSASAGLLDGSWIPLAGLFILAVGSVIAIGRVRRRDRLKLPLIALDAGECPDCGYDLCGAPPGLPLQQTNNVNVGPHACPECGVPWPLVPPPCEP